MPYTITVGNDTGGACKTTTVIELGAALALRQKKTALIGLDENSELTSYLGYDIEQLSASTADLFKPGRPLDKLLIHLPQEKVGSDDLYVAPSSPELVTRLEGVSGKAAASILKKYIARFLADFDFVLVDTPPGLNLLKVNGITAADFILIPCRYDDKTTQAATRFLEQIKGVRGETFPHYAVLVSAVDLRRRRVIAKAKKVLEPWLQNDELFFTEIPLDMAVELSQHAEVCQSVQVYQPQSRGAEAFRKLAAEILKYF
jgi:chromosome partitioning protein